MAKAIRVDGDPAAYSVTGQNATWICSEAEYQKLIDMGLLPNVPLANVERVNREDLKVLILISAGPSYDENYTGVRTSGADFRDQA